MANLNLAWDNSGVVGNPNATGQRASKRLTSVGGAYDTLAFTPANDMATSVSAAVAVVTANRSYQFKIEALCDVGGPVANLNGVQEGLKFACIVPGVTSDNSSVTITLNVASTDITKARFTLFKQADNSTVGGPSVVTRIGTTITKIFTGLLASTTYYVKIELYATVNGVEIVSSDADQLNAVCGGNISGYQVTTTADPSCPAPASLVVTAN